MERHSNPESTAEREGIVDQQDAALEAMDELEETPAGSRGDESTAEREGIVDQQDAALEAMGGDGAAS